MRERLIKLLENMDGIDHMDAREAGVDWWDVADYLLDNGVIALPCKVGDTVYLVCHKPTKCSKHQEYRDEYNCQGCEEWYCDSRIEYYVHPIDSVKLDWIVRMEDCIGDTVFFTKEEAEKALAELKGE